MAHFPQPPNFFISPSCQPFNIQPRPNFFISPSVQPFNIQPLNIAEISSLIILLFYPNTKTSTLIILLFYPNFSSFSPIILLFYPNFSYHFYSLKLKSGPLNTYLT